MEQEDRRCAQQEEGAHMHCGGKVPHKPLHGRDTQVGYISAGTLSGLPEGLVSFAPVQCAPPPSGARFATEQVGRHVPKGRRGLTWVGYPASLVAERMAALRALSGALPDPGRAFLYRSGWAPRPLWRPAEAIALVFASRSSARLL